MYIRNVTFTYDPAQEETVLHLMDEQALPAYQKLPGFVSLVSGLDRTAQRGLSVMVWDNLEQAAGARTALGNIVQQFEAAGVRFDPGQVYELVRQI